ncbi:MAG: AtpZ/AtpI family protein [Fimbriimonas sp.]
MADSAFPDPPKDEQLEARLRKLLGEEEPKPRPEDRLQQIAEEIEHIPLPQMPEVPEWNYEPKQVKRLETTSNYSGLGNGMQIAYTLMGFPMAGVLIGYFVDQPTNGSLGKALGCLVGAVLGLVVALHLMKRSNP